MTFTDDARTFLIDYCDTPAPSGFEGPAAELWCARARALGATDVNIDTVGNTYATFNAGAGPRVLLTSHLDEIGFIVTRITDEGLLRFQPIGGWDNGVVVGQRVRVITDDGILHGLIGRGSAHSLTLEERTTVKKLTDLWIEIGAADREHCARLVRIGDPVVLDAFPQFIGDNRFMARSLDNRVGGVVTLEAAALAAATDAAVEIVVTGTVCEEIGGHGARTSTATADPVVAMVIDVAPTCDTPGTTTEDVSIGKGPVVTVGAAAGSRIPRTMLDVAAAEGIDVQVTAAGRHTGTDAEDVARAGFGVPVGVLSVPTRYLHTPGETCSLDDLEATIKLLAAWTASQAGRA